MAPILIQPPSPGLDLPGVPGRICICITRAVQLSFSQLPRPRTKMYRELRRRAAGGDEAAAWTRRWMGRRYRRRVRANASSRWRTEDARDAIGATVQRPANAGPGRAARLSGPSSDDQVRLKGCGRLDCDSLYRWRLAGRCGGTCFRSLRGGLKQDERRAKTLLAVEGLHKWSDGSI
jgi:hypothetical protein